MVRSDRTWSPNQTDLDWIEATGRPLHPVLVEMEAIAEPGALRARFGEEGVFIRPFGNVIYLTPSFTIAPDELSKLTGAVVTVIGA